MTGYNENMTKEWNMIESQSKFCKKVHTTFYHSQVILSTLAPNRGSPRGAEL